jgi:hypothetical protein
VITRTRNPFQQPLSEIESSSSRTCSYWCNLASSWLLDRCACVSDCVTCSSWSSSSAASRSAAANWPAVASAAVSAASLACSGKGSLAASWTPTRPPNQLPCPATILFETGAAHASDSFTPVTKYISPLMYMPTSSASAAARSASATRARSCATSDAAAASCWLAASSTAGATSSTACDDTNCTHLRAVVCKTSMPLS